VRNIEKFPVRGYIMHSCFIYYQLEGDRMSAAVGGENGGNINWKKNLILIWLSQLLGFIGYAAAVPFIPLFMMEQFGFTDKKLSLAVAAFNFCSALFIGIFSPVWGAVADRFGRKIMLFRATFANGLIFPLMAFVPGFTMLIIIRSVASMFSGTATAAQALVVSSTPEKHQGVALGLLSSALWSGNMFGFLMGGTLVEYLGYKTAFITCGFLYMMACLILVPVKENFVRSSDVPQNKKWKFSSISTGALVLFLLLFFVGMIRNFENPYLSLKVDELCRGVKSAFWTGQLSAAAAFGGILAGLIFGRLADRLPAGWLLVPAVSLSGLFLFGQGASQTLWQLAAARFCGYMMAGGIEPVLNVILSRITPPERRASAFGVATFMRMSGFMLSTVASGAAAYYFGISGVFYTAGWLYLALMLLVIFAIFKLKSVAGNCDV